MTLEQPSLAQRYQRTIDAVSACASQYQRQASTIKLIAVSKHHSAEQVVELIKLGQHDFAENYLQEGVEKMRQVEQAIADMSDNRHTKQHLCWHFIGHVQSRKCQQVAEYFDWVHTVDSLKVAHKLNRYRTNRTPLNILIQVNLQQSSKSGVTLNELPHLVEAMEELPNLHLCGLMMIPEMESDFAKQRAIFKRCRQALEQHNLKQLSMGMSADMPAAIAEGATQLRIGTAIFGMRPSKKI